MVLVRPEQLELVSEEAGALAGEVTAYEYFGHDAVVRVRPDAPCGPGEPSLVVRVIGPTPAAAGGPGRA